jgi:ubiquinone/menaquinone biosynthesis C-methylase UbiE
MTDDPTRTDIERWILSTHTPARSTSAELMYERMESQSGERLPVLYEPLDHTKRSHWHDEALIGAFAHAMGDASTVLDVGPGDGWPALRIADRFKRVVGIDPSPRRVRVQRENAERLGITNVEFLEMDVTSMTFADRSFGGVVAASSIEQSEDPERALREVFRVLEEGGAFAMVFEDYESCLGEIEGDEELWGELSDDEAVVFYKCRRRSPPRETWYGLFLQRDALPSEDGLEARLEDLRIVSPGGAGLELLNTLSPLVTEARCFELGHLTSSAVDALLTAIGFVDVRHTDHRMPELLAFFDAASAAGKLGSSGPVFDAVAEVFGISAVERAGEGPGDFVIARKPG